MFFKGVIIVAAIVLIIILWVVFGQEFSDSKRLQNALDECIADIDNMRTSNRDLESCLNNAYNQYGSTEQKQTWFNGEH